MSETQASPALHATDWWSVATVTVGIAVFALAQGMTYPLISLLLVEAGASDLVVGLNAAAFMAGLATSVLVVPALAQRLRAGQAIVAGLVGAAIFLIGFTLTDSLLAWFILRFALGFCVNAIYVFGEAWLNAATADAVRGRVSGLYGAGMTGGFALGPLAIPLLGTDNGLAFAACAAIVSLAAFGLAIMSRRAKVEPAKLTLADLPRFFRAAPLLLLLVLGFGFVDGIVLALAPLHLIGGGASVAAAATFVAVMHIGMILAQPFLGLLLDRWDRWRVATGCLAATGLLFGLLIVVPATSAWVWPLGALGGAAFFGIYTSALALLGREHGGAMLVAGASAFSLAYATGGVIGPAATGLLAEFVPGAIFVPVALLGIVGAALLFWRRWNV
ncbi:MAG: MFS transporter [Pseudomonadota bacterium]